MAMQKIYGSILMPNNPLEQQQAAQQAFSQTNIFITPSNIDDLAKQMLMSRLDGFHGKWMREKDYIMCHVVEEVVAVFYCFGKDTGVIEDNKDLFPSDGLISQLRILRR